MKIMKIIWYSLVALVLSIVAAVVFSAQLTSDARLITSDPAPTGSLSRLILLPHHLLAPSTLRAEPMPWRIYPGAPETPNADYYKIVGGKNQPVEHRGQPVGHLTVVRYDDAAMARQAYEAIRIEAESEKMVEALDFGERGSQSGPASTWDASDLLFQQCNTVVHITQWGNTLEALRTYGKVLHELLIPVVC